MTPRGTVLAAVAALGLAAAAQAQTVLKASDVHPPGCPNVVAVENLGQTLEAATNGRYKLRRLPALRANQAAP